MVNKEVLMQELLSKFDNVFREEMNSDKDSQAIMLQGKHNNTIYTFSSIKSWLEETYVIFQNEKTIFSACLGSSFSLGDYEFGKEFKKKLLERPC